MVSQSLSLRTVMCSAAELAARLSIPCGVASLLSPGGQPAVTAGAGLSGGGDDLSYLSSSASSAGGGAGSSGSGALRPVKAVQFTKATGSKDETYGSIAVSNQTASHQPDIKNQLAIRPDVHIFKQQGPQVLILQTHTTESYAAADASGYDPAAATRSTDNAKNVSGVGGEIAKQLESYGIGVIHDTACYDYPDYTAAYDKSLAAIENYLKQYPSIQVVLDVHRDAIQYSDGTRVKPTAVIDGKKAAQVLLVAPCDESTALPVPDWQQNYRFALQLQQSMQTLYPGLARPVSLCPRRYNMQASHGSLMVEIGTDVNTLEEAEYSGRIFGHALAQLLMSLRA